MVYKYLQNRDCIIASIVTGPDTKANDSALHDIYKFCGTTSSDLVSELYGVNIESRNESREIPIARKYFQNYL